MSVTGESEPRANGTPADASSASGLSPVARSAPSRRANMPSGPHAVSLADPPNGRRGIGLVEGWRGPVVVSMTAGEGGSIRRCHPHDPSWHNWPVLEHAVIGNIVPDFPLINKSFNLSYSGHDL